VDVCVHQGGLAPLFLRAGLCKDHSVPLGEAIIMYLLHGPQKLFLTVCSPPASIPLAGSSWRRRRCCGRCARCSSSMESDTVSGYCVSTLPTLHYVLTLAQTKCPHRGDHTHRAGGLGHRKIVIVLFRCSVRSVPVDEEVACTCPISCPATPVPACQGVVMVGLADTVV
jgi:hypothetical protein